MLSRSKSFSFKKADEKERKLAMFTGVAGIRQDNPV